MRKPPPHRTVLASCLALLASAALLASTGSATAAPRRKTTTARRRARLAPTTTTRRAPKGPPSTVAPPTTNGAVAQLTAQITERAFGVPCDSLAQTMPGRPTPYVRGANCRWVVVQGYPRLYIVHVPRAGTFVPTSAHPLVFMLHGWGGSGGEMWQRSGWKEKAEQVGFVAVFPSALNVCLNERAPCPPGDPSTRWHSFGLENQIDTNWRPRGWSAAAYPADDVAFFDAMLDDLGRPGNGITVDATRRYAAGFSNGGQMVERLAVERGNVFAAAGAHAGWSLPQGEITIPIAYSMGNMDNMYEDNYGEPRPFPLPPATFLPSGIFRKSMATVLQKVGYTEASRPVSAEARPEGTFYRWEGGRAVAGTAVFADVDHIYPSTNHNACQNPYGLVMADLYWEFFSTPTHVFGGSASRFGPYTRRPCRR